MTLVGDKACCVLLLREGHWQSLWCCPSFLHCFSCRGHILTDSSKRLLLPFIWKHGSELEQYQAVMFNGHSLRLDLFKSLCFGLRGSGGNGLCSTSLCIFLVSVVNSQVFTVYKYISIFFVCIYSLLFLH